MKHINTPCGRNSHFLNGKAGGIYINHCALQGNIPTLTPAKRVVREKLLELTSYRWMYRPLYCDI
jgi:hypothetical protein